MKVEDTDEVREAQAIVGPLHTVTAKSSMTSIPRDYELYGTYVTHSHTTYYSYKKPGSWVLLLKIVDGGIFWANNERYTP